MKENSHYYLKILVPKHFLDTCRLEELLSTFIRESFFLFLFLTGGSKPWRDLYLAKVLRISNYWVLKPKQHVCINHTPRPSECYERESGKTFQPRWLEEWWEMVSSLHWFALSLMYSQQLWLPAQDLHKIKALHILA